jgi:hypothetical protein
MVQLSIINTLLQYQHNMTHSFVPMHLRVRWLLPQYHVLQQQQWQRIHPINAHSLVLNDAALCSGHVADILLAVIWVRWACGADRVRHTRALLAGTIGAYRAATAAAAASIDI